MAIPLMLVVGTIGSIDGIGLNLSGLHLHKEPSANFTSTELQLPTKGNSFEIGNVTFSHHTALGYTGLYGIRSS